MKFGMNLLLWTTRVSESDHPTLRRIKEIGFDGVEIPVFEGTSDDYKRLGRVLSDLGLGATAVTVLAPEVSPISADAGRRSAAAERLKWVIDRCAEASVEVLCGPLHSSLGVFSGRAPTREEFEWGVETFRPVADHAADAGVDLAVESLNRFENYFLTTAADALAWVNAIDKPACGLMWDTFHAHIEEKEVAGPLTSLRSRLKHVHISENDRGIPGTGLVRWEETFTTLRRVGYDRWLTIEAFGRALPELAAATRVWRDLFDDADVLCRQGLEFMRGGWERAL